MPDWEPHVRTRLSSLRLSPAREHEIVEELSQHLDDRWRELVAGGMPEDEATRAALAGFRDPNMLARYLAPLEQARQPAPITPAGSTGYVLRDLWLDMRYAARTLGKQRALTVAIVLTLAVGIGANTAIFSVVESVLLQPLPYPDEDRIVRVAATTYEGRGDRGNAFADRGYWHFVNNNRSFEKFGGYWGPLQLPLTGDGPPRRVDVASMTLSTFEVLGVSPELGRLPSPEEDAPGGPPVVLLSHELWVSQYGFDPSILGRTIDLDGTSREVVGVMPAEFDFPVYNVSTPDVDLWMPLQLDPASGNFGSVYISAIARLAPGVTIEAATSDAQSLVARFDEAGYGPGWFERVFDGGAVVRGFRDYVVGDVRRPLLIVLGTVGFVLLIACSNVANLLLVRAEGRRQENAVRMALGSSRARLAGHVLIESVMLAFMGGAVGVLLAYAGTRALVSIGPSSIPRLDEIGINGTALAFTGLAAVLAALLFGLLPALRSSSMRAMTAIRDGSRSATAGRDRHRARHTLVIGEVALTFVLVIGSGLLVRSFGALRAVDPGFSADNLLTFTVQPLRTKYEDAQVVAQFYGRLIERLEAVPGVIRVGAVNTLPLVDGGCCNTTTVVEEFPPAEGELPPTFQTRRTTPGYFEAMSIPLVEGRAFTMDDHSGRLGSVIISRSVKDTYWPDTSALGKRLTTFGIPTKEVVGVVGDVHVRGLDIGAEQSVYLPMLDPDGDTGMLSLTDPMTFTVRTAGEPLGIVSAIGSAIAELDPDLPMADVRTMDRILGDSMSRTSFTMSILLIAALIALFLGSVGIYGVLSYVTSQRIPEIGIRSALGASPGAVGRMVLTQGMKLAAIGLVIGFFGAIALGRVMVAELYEVSPFDSVTFVAASAIILGVAALASLLPAARAAGTSPVDALRSG